MQLRSWIHALVIQHFLKLGGCSGSLIRTQVHLAMNIDSCEISGRCNNAGSGSADPTIAHGLSDLSGESGLAGCLHRHRVVWFAHLIGNVLGVCDAVIAVDHKDRTLQQTPLLD